MPRRYPIFQFPNPPLIAAMFAGAAARLMRGPKAHGAAIVSAVAQLIWAYQEITDGANRFRRILGLVGAVGAGVNLTQTVREWSQPGSNR